MFASQYVIISVDIKFKHKLFEDKKISTFDITGRFA